MLIVRTVRRVAASSLVFVLLSAILVGVSSFVPAAALAGPSAQSEGDMEKLKNLSGKDFEIEFMKTMIGHHQSAIEMAKLVPDRANRQEVKDVAQRIISDQTKEITDMTGWLQQWHNTAPNSGMTMGGSSGMGMSADMTKLQGLKGDDFDKEFLTMMRTHHLSAVEMAQLVPDRTDRPELETLARNIISSQRSEIQQFEGWLKAWYNVDVASGGTPSGDMSGGNMSGGPSGDLPQAGSPSGINGLWLALALLVAVALTGGAWLRKRA